MLGSALLVASRSQRMRRMVVSAPVTRRVVDRFVAGETLPVAMSAVAGLSASGLMATIDHLGEDVASSADATASRDAYLRALDAIGAAALGRSVEVSIKLSAFGQALPGGHDIALRNALPVAAAATDAGTTVTLDMEDSSTVDSTLAVLTALRAEHPSTGAVLQSYLHRTPDDVRALASTGSRVRLVKGAYRESAEVAHQSKREIDRAYVDCLTILMAQPCYPMIASHDPRMIECGEQLAGSFGRSRDTFEFQLLYGMRPQEQLRLVREGYRARVYLPYGQDWYGYFMRRLAERPSNVRFFVRGLRTRS